MGEKSIGGFSSVEELREAIAAWCGCQYDEVPFTDVMGVPITFLDKYCPEQFEIVDLNPHFFMMVMQGFEKPKQLTLKNAGLKDPYARVLVRRRI